MKRPLTILSFLLSITGISVAITGYIFIGAILCIIAHLFAFIEAKKVTGNIQSFCAFLAHLGLGISLDLMHQGFSWFTITLCILYAVGDVRMLLFTRMGYINMKWYESVMWAIGVSFYIISNIKTSIGWEGWALPGLALFSATFSVIGMFMDMGDFIKTKNIDYLVDVGKPVPDFSLPDHEGKPISTSDFRNKQHMLLLFVRGDWCPSCHIMLRTYEKNREKFQDKNVFLLAVGPDPEGVNKQMANNLGLEYRILSDTKQEVVQRFGIQMQESHFAAKYETGIPMPASFLVDKGGIVRYTSRADRAGDFLNPNKIFDVLTTLN